MPPQSEEANENVCFPKGYINERAALVQDGDHGSTVKVKSRAGEIASLQEKPNVPVV